LNERQRNYDENGVKLRFFASETSKPPRVRAVSGILQLGVFRLKNPIQKSLQNKRIGWQKTAVDTAIRAGATGRFPP